MTDETTVATCPHCNIEVSVKCGCAKNETAVRRNADAELPEAVIAVLLVPMCVFFWGMQIIVCGFEFFHSEVEYTGLCVLSRSFFIYP